MATWTHRDTINPTTNVETYTSNSFTPTQGDLLVVLPAIGATVAAGACTASANGITFTRITTVARGGIDTQYLFVADQLVPASPSAMTVTVDVTGDAGTGCVMFVGTVAGMSRTGVSAVRQFDENNAASGTPSVTLPAACLTGNPVVAFMQNVSNPAALIEPSGFTERGDTGYATPTKGGEYATANSGITATTITWGSASATAWSAIVAEFDTSSAAVDLVVQNAEHAVSSTTADLTQAHALAVNSAAHAATSTAVVLAQAHALVVAGATHSHTADNLTLEAGATNLVVQDAAHGQAAGNVVLTQTHMLAVNGSAHGVVSTTVGLTQAHVLAVNGSTHATTAEGVALTQVHALIIAAATHATSADNVVLNTAVTLVVADAVHASTAQVATLTQVHTLAVAAAIHGQAASNVVLTQAHMLAIANALHGHIAGNVTLAVTSSLVVANGAHAQTADNLILVTFAGIPDPNPSHIDYTESLNGATNDEAGALAYTEPGWHADYAEEAL